MFYKIQLTGYFYLILVLVIFLESHGINRKQALAEEIINFDRTNRLYVSDTNKARQLLEKGINLYDRGAFTSARDLWLESALLYEKQQDILGRALALNNLALAHQQLGEWKQSSEAIAKSLQLLENQNELAKNPGYWEILAKSLNTKGNWQWKIGKSELALTSWQDSAKYYQRGGDRLGAVTSQINQAKALQALGFTVRAVKLLTTVNSQLQTESDSQLKARGMRALGIGYRNLGKLDLSATVLAKSLEISDRSLTVSGTWLELGNTYRQQGDRSLTIGKEAKAREYFTLAMQAYTKAQTAKNLLRSQLNQLSLLVAEGKYPEAETLVTRINLPHDLNANRSNIYALLNYARSLTCLRTTNSLSICDSTTANLDRYVSLSKESIETTEIIPIVQSAIAKARSIQDPIAEATALSQLAEIYEFLGELDTAKNLNQQALSLLEEKSAADISYLLQWQLGRILKRQNNLDLATIAYSQAIASLDRVRGNILLIDPQVQFSFRDRVEPVYREYADLLLTTSNNRSPSQTNLRRAIRAIDALQIAELENYLGCNLSELIKIDETTVDPNAAQIYPIVLSDRLVTIIDIPGKPLSYHETKVSQQQVTDTAISLQNNLAQPGKTPEVLERAQKLYQWAIEPNQSLLKANPQIKTLVFVPDSLLRNIPFGILYDGERYLIEGDYALVVSPQLELFAPAPSTVPLRVLTGGVEISQTIEGIEFPAIAQVQQELNQISSEITTNDPLINEAFTESNIKQQLQRGDFSAIHWKTHGVFSSDPTETFLVAYQDSIKANELQSLVQTASQNGQRPLELLVLSACETARGDNRAILGLAGLTVRTGARTALSTLWRADDRATTLLMTEFYQQLARPGITKAEALRQAQLSLIAEEGYFAPHYWATYLLVGNWL